MRFDTKLVHLGQEPELGTGDVVPPIHVASTYERRAQRSVRYFYSRGENPTREGLECCLAALEDARFATTFASGQAAGATVLSLLAPGQKVISSDDIYSGTHTLFTMLGRYGIEVEHVDLTDIERLCQALTSNVAMVWVETPTNPLLKIADLRAVCQMAHEQNIRVVVDNTFASPVLQQPLLYGADISLYSTTKSISGHSDVLGGALVYNDEELHRQFTAYRAAAGNVPGALDCFLIHRGVKTLSLRMARQVSNAKAIVEVLRGTSSVGAIHYPGLPEHPNHEVAMRQMAAPGSIVTFEYLGSPEKLLQRLRVFACAVSLGGVGSLIECPALMTHRPVPRQTRLALGISDNLIRLSAGIEDPADLVEDLMEGL
jgi:cystathionine beta-lyase/cystathionine gamma-synthase